MASMALSVRAQPDVPTGPVAAPLQAAVGATRLAATVRPTAGATYAWRVTNGSLATGQGTTAATFNVSSPGRAQVACDVTSGGTTLRSIALVDVAGPGAPVAVTVTGGGGQGTFATGAVVDVWAGAPAAGQVFNQWTGDTAGLADRTAARTLLTVPPGGAKLTATYRAAPAWTPATVANFNGSAGVALWSYFPASPVGVIVLFHGTGGSGDNWWLQAENRTFVNDAVAAGYALIALDSVDRVNKQWSTGATLTANPDLVNVVAALTRFTGQGLMTAATPLCCLGMSNGGAMAGRAADLLKGGGYPVRAAAIFCAFNSAAIAATTTVPTIWCLALNDDTIGDAGNASALANYAAMQARGIPSQIVINAPTPVDPNRFDILLASNPGLTATDTAGIYRLVKNAGLLDGRGYLNFNPRGAAAQTVLTAALGTALAARATEVEAELSVCYALHQFYGDTRRRVLGFFTAPSNTYDAAVAPVTTNAAGRIANLSCRAQVGLNGDILIPGITVGAGAPKQVLIRAAGPALAAFGVTGTLAAPVLTLASGSTIVATNRGWSTAANAAQIASAAAATGAFALAAGSGDSALLATLAPGGYTAKVEGAGGTTGVALVEVYEVDSTSAKLANLSCRAQVGAGANGLIPGITLNGPGPKQLLIRASGPALTAFGVTGVLAAPVLTLYDRNGPVAANAGWTNAPNAAQIAAAAGRVGAFAFSTSSADSALLVTLAPGGYTAQVSGVGSATGVALVEVYELP